MILFIFFLLVFIAASPILYLIPGVRELVIALWYMIVWFMIISSYVILFYLGVFSFAFSE